MAIDDPMGWHKYPDAVTVSNPAQSNIQLPMGKDICSKVQANLLECLTLGLIERQTVGQSKWELPSKNCDGRLHGLEFEEDSWNGYLSWVKPIPKQISFNHPVCCSPNYQFRSIH